MKIFFELIKSNFKQLFRDKTSLFFTFAFPVIFMLIFGLIWSGDNNFKAKVGLVYDENSYVSVAIAQTFQSVKAFDVQNGTLAEMMAKLKKGELKAVISVPAEIDASASTGEASDITVYFDPANTTTTQVILPVTAQVIEQIDRQVSNKPSILQMHTESIQSHQMRNIDFLVPGIVAMSILGTGLFCALPLIQQREKKILKRWGATPIHRSSLVYSQVIFRVVLVVLQTAILIGLAFFIFDVQMLGNWFTLLGLVILGALVLISIGYLVASFVRTEEGAMPIIQLIQFPMMFLSGIFFPVETMPGFLKPIVAAMPLTYLNDSLRQVMIQSTPIHSMTFNLMLLGGVLVVCMELSIKFFRWE